MKSIQDHYTAAMSSVILLCLFFSVDGHAQNIGKNSTTAKCIIVSDIHFNPLYGTPTDTSLKRKLIKAPVDEWESIFESSARQTAISSSLLYQDANYGILRSAIANMKARLPNPAFIVIAGDFIWHGAKPADSILKRKTIQFIARLFKQSFAGTAIIPAMGNNDTYGPDYALQDQRFLDDFADAWAPNLPRPASVAFKQNGYYSYTAAGLKLIVINSALLNYGTHYPQAAAMLKWLQTNLSDATSANIWVVMHIPPGVNVYNGSSFWNADYNQTFINDIVKYSSKVKFGIGSHTHFNDFRVFYTSGKKPEPVAFMRIVPSICSNHGNNPSFEVAEFNRGSGRIIDETNYYLNLAGISNGKSVTEVNWNDMLGLTSTFKMGKISAIDLSKLIDDIKSDTSWQLLTGYTKFYTVGTKIDSSIRVSRTNYQKYLRADSLKAN